MYQVAIHHVSEDDSYAVREVVFISQAFVQPALWPLKGRELSSIRFLSIWVLYFTVNCRYCARRLGRIEYVRVITFPVMKKPRRKTLFSSPSILVSRKKVMRFLVKRARGSFTLLYSAEYSHVELFLISKWSQISNVMFLRLDSIAENYHLINNENLKILNYKLSKFK
jgi:hypothetical protein